MTPLEPPSPAPQPASDWLLYAGLIVIGAVLFIREVHDLRSTHGGKASEAPGIETLKAREQRALASVKVLVGSAMMSLFGVSLWAGAAGLISPETSKYLFAVALVPAVAILLYTSLWGLPPRLMRWLFPR